MNDNQIPDPPHHYDSPHPHKIVEVRLIHFYPDPDVCSMERRFNQALVDGFEVPQVEVVRAGDTVVCFRWARCDKPYSDAAPRIEGG